MCVLLDNNANVAIIDNFGKKPIDYAKFKGFMD
jgi:hypothetical protein